MKIPPSWQTAACGAGLFLTASAACFCAAEQLWLTAAVCVAAFVGLYASLHHRQTRQIRLLRSFIRGIRHSGLKEIPRFVPEESARALGLEREIEHTLAAYRQQLFDEATRQKYYQLLLDHVDTGIVRRRRARGMDEPGGYGTSRYMPARAGGMVAAVRTGGARSTGGTPRADERPPALAHTLHFG